MSPLAVPGPLDRIRTALRNSSTTPMNWLALGHSVVEGSSNGSMTTNEIRDRWVNKVLTSLQSTYASGVGGPGFTRTYYEQVTAGSLTGSAAGVNYWTRSGTNTGTGVANDTRAFGSQTYNAGVDEVITLNYTGTSFMLQFDLGGSSFTSNVDGGGAVTVTPGAGSTMQGTYTSPLLAHNTHTAVLTPTSGQALKVRGAFIYDGDETTGLRLWEHALGGQTSTQFIAAGKPGTITGLTDPLALCANPTLVTIMLGINNYIFNTTPGTTTSDYQTLIANVKSLCTGGFVPNFLLVIDYEVGQNYGSPPYTFTWAQFVTAIKNVAAADPQNVAYLDLGPQFAVPAAGNSYVGGQFNSDQTHPTATGYAAIATIISDVLGPKGQKQMSGGRPASFKPGLAR